MDFDVVTENLADFGYTCDDDDKVVSKLTQLSAQFNLSDDDLVDEIIAFANNQKRKNVDLPLVEAMEPELVKKLKRTLEVKSAQKPKRSALMERTPVAFDLNNSCVESDSSFMSVDNSSATPLTGHYLNFQPVKNTPAHSKFISRTIRGTVASTYKGSMFVDNQAASTGKINVEMVSEPATTLYASDKAASVIDAKYERMDVFAEYVRDANPEVTNWTRTVEASSDEVSLVGEIVRESTEGVALRDGTAQLMVYDEAGTIISLDLSQLPTISIFPGQLVAFEGVNESGDCLLAKRQLLPAPMPIATVQKSDVTVDNLRLWCAAGPFCSNESAGYEPLCDLFELAKKERPHAIILMGPFVDRRNKFMSAPEFETTRREVMKNLLIQIARAMEHCPTTEVILQPSPVRDSVSLGHFPAAPFELPTETHKKRLHVVSDPAVIRISGVEIALTSTEIVAHLSRCEFHRSEEQENSDRIGRLANHILSQRSLYPLSPAALPCQLSDCLRLSSLVTAPHLLLIPSVLPPSIKLSSGTVMCNPGMLLRGSMGTFARCEINLSIAAGGQTELAESSLWQIVNI